MMYQRYTLVRTPTPTVQKRCQRMCKQPAKVRNELSHQVGKSWTCKNSVLTSRVIFLLKWIEIWVFAHWTSLREPFVVMLTDQWLTIFVCFFETLWRCVFNKSPLDIACVVMLRFPCFHNTLALNFVMKYPYTLEQPTWARIGGVHQLGRI